MARKATEEKKEASANEKKEASANEEEIAPAEVSSGGEEAPPKKKKKKTKAAASPEEGSSEDTQEKKKKTKATASSAEESSEETGGKKKKAHKKSKSGDRNPKIREMIFEALTFLDNGRRGSSVQSIKKVILENYKVRENMLSSTMKKAFTQGLENKTLARPKDLAESNVALLCGRYVLTNQSADGEVKEPRKPRPQTLRQFTASGVVKPTEAAKPKKKKKKRAAY